MTHLAWFFTQKISYKGGLVGDACGLGKLHEIQASLLAGYEARQKSPFLGSPGVTMLVVPHSDHDRAYEDCLCDLGEGRTVHKMANSNFNAILHPTSRLFANKEARQRTLIVTA